MATVNERVAQMRARNKIALDKEHRKQGTLIQKSFIKYLKSHKEGVLLCVATNFSLKKLKKLGYHPV